MPSTGASASERVLCQTLVENFCRKLLSKAEMVPVVSRPEKWMLRQTFSNKSFRQRFSTKVFERVGGRPGKLTDIHVSESYWVGSKIGGWCRRRYSGLLQSQRRKLSEGTQ